MTESTQYLLTKIRPPRVQIVYEVETGGAIEKKELPFVLGIISDLFGHNKDVKPYTERIFVYIDSDNFNDVMKSIHPTLQLSIANKIQEPSSNDDSSETSDKDDVKTNKNKSDKNKESSDSSETSDEADVQTDKNKSDKHKKSSNTSETKIAISLAFKSIDDFSPTQIVKSVPELNELLSNRNDLVDFAAKIDANINLHSIIVELLQNDSEIAKLAKENIDDAKIATQIITDSLMTTSEDIKIINHCKKILITFAKYFVQQNGNLSLQNKDNLYGISMQFIANIDQKLSNQMDEILHHSDFQSLEARWRNLHHLVYNAHTGQGIKLRIFAATRDEIQSDLEKASEFDQSHLFKLIYEKEYGTIGGIPYTCLLGDFRFGRSAYDVTLITLLASVASASHAPFLAAASPEMFDLKSFQSLDSIRNLANSFDSSEAIAWNSFRSSEDARYMNLFLPSVLVRNTYGPKGIPVKEFNYTETVHGESDNTFCWGNAAYAMAEKILTAYFKYGWSAAIRGVEGGGLVEHLPIYTFQTSSGDISMKCPTEVAITDRREKELSDLGFIALCHAKGTDTAVFFGSQSTQKPKKYNLPEATSNAALSSRLSYIINASRFAHYIKVMMREKIGSFMSPENVEDYLQEWISDYVLLDDDASQDIKAMYPLREADIQVFDNKENPGEYSSVIFLRPHFQLEGLTVSLRLVASIPKGDD